MNKHYFPLSLITLALTLLPGSVMAHAGAALHSHGNEMPVALNAFSYSLDFAAAAALLLMAGIGVRIALKNAKHTPPAWDCRLPKLD